MWHESCNGFYKRYFYNMKIITNLGNIFDSTATIIAHQCNGIGVMGSGVAKEVKERYPRVFKKYKQAIDSDLLKLGSCQVVAVDETKTKFVANLCGQWNFGSDGKRYTSYDAIYNALEKLADYCVKKSIKSVAFPYKMSSDRGGASWDVVFAMIQDVFKDNEEIIIEIWKYNGKK